MTDDVIQMRMMEMMIDVCMYGMMSMMMIMMMMIMMMIVMIDVMTKIIRVIYGHVSSIEFRWRDAEVGV